MALNKAMNRLVSIPPMAKVTDQGWMAHINAVATPAAVEPSLRPRRSRIKAVIASAAALTSSAITGNGASGPPSGNPRALSSRAYRGVVVPRTASPELNTSP